LHYRADLNMRVPECEILTTTIPVKAHIRNREFFKILSVMETGAEEGMWTWQRYRSWMEKKRNWFRPHTTADSADAENADVEAAALPPVWPASMGPTKTPPPRSSSDTDRIVIEPDDVSLADLLKELK
jgi:twitching motility protein PilT